MVKRTSFEGDSCPIARSLEAIGDWWSLLIIREALFGLRRFGEFQSKLGMAKNILSARLHSLVDHGILETAPASDGSAYQEYVLTPKGRGTFPILVALRQWSEEFDDHPEQIATILVDRDKGRPVKKLEMHADCHHAVIASAAKQSRLPPRQDSGLLRCARNDEVRAAPPTSSPSP